MKTNIERELLVCSCESLEHQLVFTYFDDGTYIEVYCEVHLTKLSFWERLKHGVKYIFGYQSRFGAFESVIINPEDYDKFQHIADTLKSINQK